MNSEQAQQILLQYGDLLGYSEWIKFRKIVKKTNPQPRGSLPACLFPGYITKNDERFSRLKELLND